MARASLLRGAQGGVLLALLAAGMYGFFHEGLATQPMWSPDGASRIITFSVLYWATASILLWLKRGMHVWIPAAATLLYTMWWSGPAAPLATLYFIGSCYFLGRVAHALMRATSRLVSTLGRRKTSVASSGDAARMSACATSDALTSTMLGTAIWMSLMWALLHFPVNTRWVYLVLLGLPYLAGSGVGQAILSPVIRSTPPRQATRLPIPPPFFRNLLSPSVENSLGFRTATALVVFLLMILCLLALKPDVSSDGLSMHLALPSIVADQARWPFDFEHYIWAVMPASVDAMYAAVYLLGGEPAARLLNFAYLMLTAGLVFQGARRWVSPTVAMLGVALFVSTPLTALVTGTLFIENAWTALILASVLALLRYVDSTERRELYLTTVFAGAAAGAKLIAVAYAAPVVLIALWMTVRARQWRLALAATGVLAALTMPPYVFAMVKTGNPIFPFSNATFRSPHYYTDASFNDVRYHASLTWRTPYDLTFHSTAYVEEMPGAPGFQYFLLLIPAALLVRRRDQAILLACSLLPSLLILVMLPNLRYLYAALPLLSIAITWLASNPQAYARGYNPARQSGDFLQWSIAVALVAMNVWFLPAGDGYDADFALFRKQGITPYLERMAPARPLIEHLNRTARGEPVAFFGTDAIAGLHAPAYTDNWHSEHYWKRVRDTRDSAEIRAYFHELGIAHVIAPVARTAQFRGVAEFLVRWLDSDGPTAGPLGVFRVRDTALPIPKDTRPLETGMYEDTEPRIEYSKEWITDRQFREATGDSVTYTEVPGETFHFRFRGTGVTYFYTRALNRGIAEVRIDDRPVAQIDAYSAATEWQASRGFNGLEEGIHTFEVRGTGKRNPRSSSTFVDVDKIVVR